MDQINFLTQTLKKRVSPLIVFSNKIKKFIGAVDYNYEPDESGKCVLTNNKTVNCEFMYGKLKSIQ